MEAIAVGADEDALRDDTRQRQLARLNERFERVDRGTDGRCGVDAPHVEGDGAALEPSEFQDAVGKPGEPPRLVANDAETLLIGGQDAVLHGLDGRLDGL